MSKAKNEKRYNDIINDSKLYSFMMFVFVSNIIVYIYPCLSIPEEENTKMRGISRRENGNLHF